MVMTEDSLDQGGNYKDRKSSSRLFLSMSHNWGVLVSSSSKWAIMGLFSGMGKTIMATVKIMETQILSWKHYFELAVRQLSRFL